MGQEIVAAWAQIHHSHLNFLADHMPGSMTFLSVSYRPSPGHHQIYPKHQPSGITHTEIK